MKSVYFPLSGNESAKTVDYILNTAEALKNYDTSICLHTENKNIQENLKRRHIKYEILGIDHRIFPKESFIKNFFISYVSSPKIFSFLMEKKPYIIHSFDVGTSLMWNSASHMNGQKLILSQTAEWDYPYFVGTIVGTANKIISPSKRYASSLPATLHRKTVIINPFIKDSDADFDLKKVLKIHDDNSIVLAISSSNKSRTISFGEKLNSFFGKKIYMVMNSTKPFELKDTDIEIIGVPYKSFPKGADAFIIFDDEDDVYTEVKMAFHHHVPVFGVRNSMTVELIEDGETGFLINSDSADDIADKIISLWDLRGQMTDVASSSPLPTLNEYIKKLEEIYESL